MFWFSSLTTLFVYSALTKAQHCTWTENRELTANLVDADALLYMCHFSSETCSTKQDERNSVWGQHLFQKCLTTFKLRYTTSPKKSSSDQACTKKHSTNTCRECNVLGNWVDWEGIAGKLKATIPVLQGQQPRHSNPNRYNPALLAFTYQRAQQRNKDMAENHTKSLV